MAETIKEGKWDAINDGYRMRLREAIMNEYRAKQKPEKDAMGRRVKLERAKSMKLDLNDPASVESYLAA